MNRPKDAQKRRDAVDVATILVLVCGIGLSPRAADAQTVGTCAPALAEAYLDIGNVRARILNDGSLFYRGEPHVYEVPKGTGSNAIFAGGFWIGGMIGGTLHMAATRYGPYEFWPGPIDDDGRPPDDCAAYDRMYRISRADVARYEATGAAKPDLVDWPTGLGAPTLDPFGQPLDLVSEPLVARRNRRIDLAAGERPDFLGDQMIWWVMNDLGNTHTATGGEPLGVEVHGLAFAFDVPGVVGNATFYRYTILNRGGLAITDAYISLFSDADLGDFSDDRIGSDSLLGLGYVWNSDNEDTGSTGYGTPPPALGYDVFQGPTIPSPGDVARVGRRLIPDHRNLPLTAVIAYGGGGGVTDEPRTAEDYYNYMQGRWKNGQPMTEGGNGGDYSDIPTRWIYSGDAANCAYWTECNYDGSGSVIAPGDRRFINSTGPFEIAAGSRQELLFGIVYARGSDNFDSVRQLKLADIALQRFVDSGFTDWPAPPPAPTIIPQLLSPAEAASGQPLNSTLVWSCPAEAFQCTMMLATDRNFDLVLEQTRGERLDVELEPETTYWWRARAIGPNDVPGPWTAPRSFRTGSDRVGTSLADFQVVSNGIGPLDPPECGAFNINGSGFPLVACGAGRPDGSRQQSGGLLSATQGWGIHKGGGGDEIRFGPESNRSTYLGRSWGSRGATGSVAALGYYLYEIRFTEAGGRARRPFDFDLDRWMDVPFELWRSPQETPDDQSDDVRLVPGICESACGGGMEPGRFDIGGDHPISAGDDDPFSDLIYWYVPDDESPGDAGYQAFFFGDGDAHEVMARQVLVCVDCGASEPYAQSLPEPGTTFRYVTTPPEPPVLAAPGSGPAIRGSDVRFFWTAAASVDFTLQIGTNPAFHTIVKEVPDAVSGDTVSLPGAGIYYWRVGTREIGWSDTWVLNIVSGTDAETAGELPTEFAISDVYPNPFNPVATVRFGLPVDAEVTIDVVDVLGRRVAVLERGSRFAAGWHRAQLDGSRLASGVYFVRMRAGGRLDSKPVVMLK